MKNSCDEYVSFSAGTDSKSITMQGIYNTVDFLKTRW